MPLYLDLQPSPQFDSSLVTYCVVNFQRIKDLLRRANLRVSFEVFNIYGGWPKSQSFNVPYKADVWIWSEATAYTTAGGFHGIYIDFDGGPMFLSMDQYWNEAFTHKAISVTNVMRGISAGTHYVTIRHGDGVVASNEGDVCRLGLTYYEV